MAMADYPVKGLSFLSVLFDRGFSPITYGSLMLPGSAKPKNKRGKLSGLEDSTIKKNPMKGLRLGIQRVKFYRMFVTPITKEVEELVKLELRGNKESFHQELILPLMLN